MIFLPDLILTVFYAAFGILLMIVSNIVMDFFIPGNFAEEIRRGNRVALGRLLHRHRRDSARRHPLARL